MKDIGSMDDGSRPCAIILVNIPCMISGDMSGIPGIAGIAGIAGAALAGAPPAAPGIGGTPIVKNACISSTCFF